MKINKVRENLIDRMIRIYGFEHPAIIDFCALCEQPHISDQQLESIVAANEEYARKEIEDDE